MASKELQLVSRIVYSGDLRTVIEWGITSDDFLTSEGRAFFSHLSGYHASKGTEGSVLGPQFVQENYPNFIRCDDEGMTTDALCLEVRKERLAIELNNIVAEVTEIASHDPLEALSLMQGEATRLQNIGTGRSSDMTLGVAFNLVMHRYQQTKEGIDTSVCSWPWQALNEVTMGFQKDDYIVFYGRPKSFKSWVLAYIISWIADQGKRALIYTKEMKAENIYARVISCMAGVDYQGLRTGNLPLEEEQALADMQTYLHQMQMNDQLLCLSGQDAPEGGDTVQWLRSKAEKFAPEFIFIDGMYLMSDTRKAKDDHARVRNISRDLRQMNLALGIPLICTLQANRAAAKHNKGAFDEIAFSDAIGQDATNVMRVINEGNKNTCQIVLAGAREFRLNGFRINAVPSYNFSQHSLLTEQEITEAKKNDGVVEEDNSKAHVATNGKKPIKRTQDSDLANLDKRMNKEF